MTQILNSQTSQFSSPYLLSPPFSEIDTGASAARLAGAALSPFRRPADGQVQRGGPLCHVYLPNEVPDRVVVTIISGTVPFDQSIARVVGPRLSARRRRVVS